MSQNSLVLPTVGVVSGLQMTQDANNALDSLNTLNSGASAPSSAEAGSLWHNTSTNVLNIYSLNLSSWIPLVYLNESSYIANFAATSTNDTPIAGTIGEWKSSIIASSAAAALSSNIASSITSISLTAGDWDVWGTAIFSGPVNTTVTAFQVNIGTTASSVTLAGDGSYGAFGQAAGAPFATVSYRTMPIGPVRATISSTTIYYINGVATFAVSSCSSFGSIYARRAR